ncbi:NTPase KAP family P-loop domain-containing protein 1 isoform X2 [Struthio camelus]|uniref:NTPase KAP family P-loop domain-containing protein 1 isoform X2 n=1 Tax=Struthio camelus TaxID=8801 RepID=UPI003603E318
MWPEVAGSAGGCCPLCTAGPETPMSFGEENVACLGPAEECRGCGHPPACGDRAFVEVEPGEHQELLTEDDIYCRCLSKTLCHTSTPVTVGFYAPCGQRLYSLLDKVTGFMQEEMARREEAELQKSHQKPRSPEGWGLLQALWYLAFYKPVITEVHLRRKNIKFIFIRFSAWQYAGCDKLWAGLVTTLCDSIRHHFGALPLSLYHVMGSRPHFASGFSQKEWILKKNTCLKLWGLLFVLSAGLSVLLVALLVPGIKDNRALKVIGSTIASLSGSGLVLGAVSVIKNLLISEKKKIERLTNSEKFTSQLGFMSKVRNEIEALINFLAFMEIFEKRRLRVVLEITSLDICFPEKVAGVLNAMNTLLSDANSPFIFILVVDPSVIVPCLEQTSCMKGLADNGYLYLNRTVTLPFSIPEMGLRSKLQCLEDAVQTREDLMYRIITRNVERNLHRSRAKGEPAAPRERSRHELDAEAVRYIHAAFRCLHDDTDRLSRYVPSSSVQMRRIVNTIPITLRLMLHHGGPRRDISPRAAAAWVVLANQWPCRLSWALQCLEDARQQSQPAAALGSRSLWSIFQENLKELCSAREVLRNVLCLDGDPELFETFLARDFPFSARQAGDLLEFTVNLDHSIRRKMGLLRGLDRLAKGAAAPVSRSVQCPHPE